jgi:hypothetical protein
MSGHLECCIRTPVNLIQPTKFQTKYSSQIWANFMKMRLGEEFAIKSIYIEYLGIWSDIL